jgi:outer membrane translocation and assembly module TamA
VVLLQAEYRWEVLPYLSGALFYDAGSVAAERQEFRLDSLKHDYGFGLRFGVGAGVFLRTDMAFGGAEGARFSWRFNNVF